MAGKGGLDHKMADVQNKNYKIYKNSKFEVLTQDGFKDFHGIIIGKNTKKVKIITDKNNTLVCTPKHKIMLNNEDWVYAKDLKIEDKIWGGSSISEIEYFESDDLVYEFLEVEDTHTYIVNGILSHQCLMLDEFAFIRPEIAHAFYEAVSPTISSSKKAKVIMTSTPNGTTGKFYELYSGGEKIGTKHWNRWHVSRIMWDEIPRYNLEGELDYDGFKNDQIALLGGDMNSWLQEYCCVFLETGAAAINLSVLEELKKSCKRPLFSFDDGDYIVFEEPIPGHIYTIGVDTSEGVGLDYSVAQILDITDLKDIRQVAQYHSNMIQPYVFAEKLNKVARGWGRPFIAIERNGPGGQVIDALYEIHHYDNIIHYSMNNDKRGVYQKMGVYCHTNSKYTGIMNMKYWIEHLRAVTVYDINTLKEYETFRRKENGTWSAQEGHYDDRIMSLVWALIPLETEIAQKYFSILQYDDVGKPKIIKDPSAEFKDYLGPLWDADSVSMSNYGSPSPSFFGVNPADLYQTQSQKDMLDMGVQGWTIL